MREGENPEVNRVSGYRQLSDDELQLVNDIKAMGPQIEALIERAKRTATADTRLDPSDRLRSAAVAQTNIQQGFMWLIRAVAAPKGLV